MKIRVKVLTFDCCSLDAQHEVRERALAGLLYK